MTKNILIEGRLTIYLKLVYVNAQLLKLEEETLREGSEEDKGV